ncbi:Transcription elongation factor spt5 [Schizosaccharomyces pombe]|uniref:Transcription elongation factor spt5 n=365 Tax=root TaxID=1 RepID=SPT5_SCHPO|nr:transcription elongation factor Spt5 [Schizosaccharomyces pombe]O13936.1 RecName: Full=Transcription elongation factor spt5; AltName: Full=Chromatin elongation factor spt5 [Schizosaccharomyces pombe 972h-]CAB16890.1 transcription elongation factor Spt5 [Schizosaccharomyces pombe]|eukprot:NP_593191.1 transcription elongation factor Spt5 [Schizosaccharomyces pombe]
MDTNSPKSIDKDANSTEVDAAEQDAASVKINSTRASPNGSDLLNDDSEAAKITTNEKQSSPVDSHNESPNDTTINKGEDGNENEVDNVNNNDKKEDEDNVEENEEEADANEEEEEDEEDDEEDEEDEDESGGGRRKRARHDRRNQFLDIEAEVDEDEEELEDEEDEIGREDGFIEEEVGADYVGDDRRHRELDRQRQELQSVDAERLAEEYREKYGRSQTVVGDTSNVPQRLLLPSVNDPNIWAVRCKIGKEKDIVFTIMRKAMDLQYTSSPLEIISAFQRDSLVGYIYVEARKQSHVLDALNGVLNVYTNNMILVPIKEMPDLLKVQKQVVELLPGAYVRIRRGKYAGDLAQVDNLSENGLTARVRIVPRIDYSDGLKRKNSATRPQARLFNESEAFKSNPSKFSKRGPRLFLFNNEEFEDGFLVKDIRISSLITEGVNPTLDEVSKFNPNNEDLDLSSLALSVKGGHAEFQPGDHVEVYVGEQTGVSGVVENVRGSVITMVSSDGLRLDVPSRGLRKRFRHGDYVKVIAGKYKDDTGMVVRISKDEVTFLSDTLMTELTVFSRDLGEASSAQAVNSAYELHDLVQLDVNTVACIFSVDRDTYKVIDQNGGVRTVLASQITMRHSNRRGVATDRNGAEIRIGDKVKEVGGEGKQGTILHIYRAFVFLHNRDIAENNGVFSARSRNVATIAAKGARISADLTKMNPALSNGPALPPVANLKRTIGRDKAIGATVRIRRGPMKGLLGVIKDTTDANARVELHTGNKMVTIPKENLLYTTKTGELISYTEFIERSRGIRPGSISTADGPNVPNWAQGARTPAVANGSRTPAWNTGSRTPAWNSGSKTPAWNSGSRTPAWNSGNKTPAWNAGSRTPAWNSGNKTPAWNVGNKTPAWNSGAKTPAWNAGNKTPSWNNGTKTPAWNANQTPMVANGTNTSWGQTPAYGGFSETNWDTEDNSKPYTAPTPGAWAAPTPGGWDDEEGDSPKYVPPSP